MDKTRAAPSRRGDTCLGFQTRTGRCIHSCTTHTKTNIEPQWRYLYESIKIMTYMHMHMYETLMCHLRSRCTTSSEHACSCVYRLEISSASATERCLPCAHCTRKGLPSFSARSPRSTLSFHFLACFGLTVFIKRMTAGISSASFPLWIAEYGFRMSVVLIVTPLPPARKQGLDGLHRASVPPVSMCAMYYTYQTTGCRCIAKSCVYTRSCVVVDHC